MPRGRIVEAQSDDVNLGVELASLLGVGSDKKLAPIANAHDFVRDFCYTLDPHDERNPIKKFPDTPYIHDIIDVWLKENLLLIVKSRQMMISWLMVALHLWLVLTRRGQVIFFISKKEDDAGLARTLSLLSRAHFMWERLPKEFKVPCRKGLQPPTLRFTSRDGEIYGLSQDSDAVRSYTASAIFCDEWAFQERADKTFAAMKATIDGGGKLTGVSTPNGKRNLFYRLSHDVRED